MPVFPEDPDPIQLALSPVRIKETLRCLTSMKNCVRSSAQLIANLKRKRLDFAADLRCIPSPSRTSVVAVRSIRDDAVQQPEVHKNMQQMIDCFLHKPDNQNDAPSWPPNRRRCAAARTNTARAPSPAGLRLSPNAAWPIRRRPSAYGLCCHSVTAVRRRPLNGLAGLSSPAPPAQQSLW